MILSGEVRAVPPAVPDDAHAARPMIIEKRATLTGMFRSKGASGMLYGRGRSGSKIQGA